MIAFGLTAAASGTRSPFLAGGGGSNGKGAAALLQSLAAAAIKARKSNKTRKLN